MNLPASPVVAATAGSHRTADDDVLLLDEALEPRFHLRSLIPIVYRNRMLVGSIMGVSLLLGILSIFLSTKVYEAHASIQIEQQSAKVLGTEDTEPVAFGMDAERFLQTQGDIISSRSMALRVSDSLGLAATTQFLESMGVASSKNSDPVLRKNHVIETLQKNLTVILPRNSRLVTIAFKSRSAKLSADIVNSYVKNFIDSNIKRKFLTTASSRDFLQNQLGIAKERLEGSERALIDYARSASLIDASAGAAPAAKPQAPSSLITANLVQLNEDYANAAATRAQAEQRWQEARRTPLYSLPEVLSNQAVQQLLQKRAELNADLSQLRQRLKPDHPTVLQANAQLQELDSQAKTLAEGIRNSIQNQFNTAFRQEQAIGAKVASLKQQTLAEQDRSVRYNILKREADTNRQLYDALLQRYKEVSAEAGITSNNISVIDSADVPLKPASPRPLFNMAIALALGAIVSGFIVIGRERLDDAIRDPGDVELKLHLPLLGVVPEVEGQTPEESLADRRSTMSEAYYAVRSAIQLSSNRGMFKSLLITSSEQGEGKSTTSYALATAFAQLGKSVLIVDADLRRPSLHTKFNVEQTKGFSSVLAQLETLESAIQPTPVANLKMLPSGPLPPDPANLFAGERLSDLLQQLESAFDLVILDAPPVLALADAPTLAAAADATIFVAQSGDVHFGNARSAIRRLARSHARLIGCVVTKYNGKKSGYGAGAEYYDYRYRT